MKFGRTMLVVSVVAVLGLLAAGVHGYSALDAGAEGPELSNHVLLGLVALLLFVLAHGWVLIYLTGMGRLLRVEARAAGREEVLDCSLRSGWRRTLPPVLVTLAAVGIFVLGTAAHAGRVPGTLHGAALWVTVGLQGWAVAAEWRALAASERALTALRR